MVWRYILLYELFVYPIYENLAMRTILAALGMLLMPFALCAQGKNAVAKEYTFTGDNEVRKEEDLYGVTIHPKDGKLTSSPITRKVGLGLVEFRITKNDLYVIENVKFSTSGIISETDYKNYRLTVQKVQHDKASGVFEIVLVDMRNPDIQGHLKVFASAGEISKLQFRPAGNEAERTYILAPTPPEIEHRDGKFFTHTEDLEIEAPTDLWTRSQNISPFSEVKSKGNKGEFTEVRRIYPSDRVKISFEEREEAKGKKKVLVQYIVITSADASGSEVKKEFLVKKIREVLPLSADKNDKNAVKDIVLTLNNAEEQETTMTIVRNSRRRIQAISFIEAEGTLLTYKMRKGSAKK